MRSGSTSTTVGIAEAGAAEIERWLKSTDPIILAVPKGRILEEALPLLAHAGIVPEPAFSDESSRALRFKTNRPDIDLIRVRVGPIKLDNLPEGKWRVITAEERAALVG